MVGHKPETYSNNILFNSHKDKWKERVQGYAVEGAEGGVAKKGFGSSNGSDTLALLYTCTFRTWK